MSVELVVVEKDYVKALVDSASQPGLKHVVEVTSNGAICDCKGSLRKRDCVHVKAVLEKIPSHIRSNLVTWERRVEAYYVATDSFIDLFGGLIAGEVTLFYGPHGAGKSMGAMTIAARYASHADGKIVYVNTETGDPSCRFNKKFMEQVNPASIDKTVFFVPRSNAELNVFLGGRGEKDDKPKTTLEKFMPVSLLVVDSVTRFYNVDVLNVPPPQKLQVAAAFAGRLGVWINYLQRLMVSSQQPFPVIFTAWMRSPSADKLAAKEKTEQEIAEMLDARKEWTGPRALGHYAKTIYRVLPAGPGICEYKQVRGEYEGKSIRLKITSRGVVYE